MTPRPQKVEFAGAGGDILAARLDLPAGAPRAYAIFAHCFTCSKDIFAASRIAAGLAAKGIATLRFDFTGLGASQGEFANTNFSSNIADLIRAADFLRANYMAPGLLIGHSLGGAAVLAAAGDIAEVKAVATIGAPSSASHVTANFSAHVDDIEKDGSAEVILGGRKFTIQKQFLRDIEGHSLTRRIARLKRALMVMHSPLDATVGIDNAGEIFAAAKHPKSFVSLDGADHLLSRRDDAAYVADILCAWSARYIASAVADQPASDPGGDDHTYAVSVAETGNGKYQQKVTSGPHTLLADEPVSVGGLNSGPSPYDFMSIALGACTSMTLRMYADFKKIDLGRLAVEVSHEKIHAKDCADCGEGKTGRIDRFERVISVDGHVSAEMRAKIIEIAGKCPVHRTLKKSSAVATRLSVQPDS